MNPTPRALPAATVAPWRFAVLLGAVAWITPLQANDTVRIYRCTDADGALTVQNDQPCPSGHRQQVQVIDVPPALPAHVPRERVMPKVVAAEKARRDAAIRAALPEPVPPEERKAPTALFQCTTWNNDTYLTEDEVPAERCAPMRVVGLDGRARPGTGAACRTTRDRCGAIAEDDLCKAWQRRVDEAEFRWKFAGSQAEDPRRLEYETLAVRLANTTCADG